MATSTLIQYLETSGTDALTGAPASVGTAAMDRRQIETFLAAGTIGAGDFVSLDASQTDDANKAVFVKPCDSADTSASCPVGVALAAATAGEKVEVVIRGVCEARTAAVAQGDVLTHSATSGQAAVIAAATDPQIAVALDATGAPATITVFVRGQF
jgi:hypothetical protein